MSFSSASESQPVQDPELVIQTSRGERRIKPISQQSLWDKLARYARQAGLGVCERALWLWYTAQSPNTPKWAKRTAYGALAYFILPVDAIPDMIPIAGFSDDFSALSAALGVIAIYVTPEIKDKASTTLKQWLG